MTTARAIVEGALGFRLNRLSPGETLDADTANLCLTALNEIADTMNGSGLFLFRELLTAGTALSAASGTLGSTWASLTPGVKILGATYNDGSTDNEMHELSMAQYHVIAQKTSTGEPTNWAHDGYATVFVYPVPTSIVITLRTKQSVSSFADLDTDYGMPDGYRANLSALLAEKLAPPLLGNIPTAVAREAATARSALASRNMRPAILRPYSAHPNILTGP